MTMPRHVPNPDRPEGMSAREYQMYRRFPQGSYARVKREAPYGQTSPLTGQVVRICEVVDDSTTRFRVRTKPFDDGDHGTRKVYMRNLEPLNAMEVIAEAAR